MIQNLWSREHYMSIDVGSVSRTRFDNRSRKHHGPLDFEVCVPQEYHDCGIKFEGAEWRQLPLSCSRWIRHDARFHLKAIPAWQLDVPTLFRVGRQHAAQPFS